MRTRSGLSPSLVLVLLLPLMLISCSSGGGDDASPSSQSNNPAAAQPTEFLVASPAGLWRGQATGKGNIVFARPNLQQSITIVESDGHVVYERETGTQTDIWTVKADGTGDHALANAPEDEAIEAIKGPWLIYLRQEPGGSGEAHWSARIDTGVQLGIERPFEFGVDRVQFQNANRIIITGETLVRSITTTGTDKISYPALSDEEIARRPEIIVFSASFLQDDQKLIFVRGSNVGGTTKNVFSIPLVGGTRTPLDDDQAYVSLVGLLGGRVVYHRCSVTPASTGPCDVVSVQTDGGNKAVLAFQPANEAVQGFTSNQVIIRRNLNGPDQLIAVPVTGGPETPLMIMADNEFVDRTVGDLIILRRPTGTWTLDLNGNLTRLGSTPGLDRFAVVGDRICSDIGEVKCMPLNGSGPEVRIATNAKIVGVL